MGVAKLVVDSKTSARALQAAISVLELVVSRTSQDALVSVLSEEVHGLRRCVTELQQVHLKPLADPVDAEAPVASPGAETAGTRNLALVNRAVEHLQRRYLEPNLSLTALAETLGCNRQYLSHRFTQIAGEHLHTYLITLRVAHACRLLMGTELLVKEVAHATGFPGQAGMARAFLRYVGVSPVEYRRIFAAP